jgi:uncharacterized delta-60 repeat protein
MLIRRLFFPTFLFILGAFPIYLKAQIPGSLDLSFDPGSGVNSITAEVNESLQLPDGKIMAVGYFSSFGGSTEMNRIAKLNSDGTPASGFISGVTAPSLTNSSFRMYCLALQDDGKVLIGGNFTNYNGYIRNKIARINQDGTIDLSFDPGSGFSNTLSSIKDIKIQQDGKILVAGDFTSYNGTNYSGIIRLNQDGSLDTSFIPQTGIYQFQINSVDIQADGKIIAGGPFAYIGTTNVRIVRFNIDGTIDSTFNPNANGSATNINKILIQPDGKVIIAGMFSSMNGNQSIKNITRVDTNGNIDAGFLVGSDPQGMIYDLHLDPNGKIVVVGSFTIWNSITAHRILRLNSNGTFDSSFNSGDGANNAINCVTNQADGKYLIGGAYSQYDNTSRKGFARLNGNGTNDIIDNQITHFIAYPNPFNESIEIESGSLIQEILVYDITGKTVFSESFNTSNLTVNTINWKSGVYFIKIENQTIKVIKE